jgi:hypothetical protein
LIKKKLISRVFPGVFPILANPLRFRRLLINEDLPTFERPTKAISGMLSIGNCFFSTAPVIKSDDLIIIIIARFKFYLQGTITPLSILLKKILEIIEKLVS